MRTTTTEQIACIRRELGLRRNVFPGRAGKMLAETAEREIAAMEDILERLRLTDEGEAETTFPFLCHQTPTSNISPMSPSGI